MKNKQNVEVVELLSGVPFLSKIMEILKSKEFIDTDFQRPEKFFLIGEMSPVERACYSVLVKMKSDEKFYKEIDFFLWELVRSRMKKNHENHDLLIFCKGFLIMKKPKHRGPLKAIDKFRNIEKMSVEEMLTVSLKDTFIEGILKIIQNEAFIDESEPIENGEILIRKMNVFEKSLKTLISKLTEDVNLQIDEFQNIIQKDKAITHKSYPIKTIIEGLSDDNPNKKRLIMIEKTMETKNHKIGHLDDLFWKIVLCDILNKNKKITIKQGFKLVYCAWYNKSCQFLDSFLCYNDKIIYKFCAK